MRPPPPSAAAARRSAAAGFALACALAAVLAPAAAEPRDGAATAQQLPVIERLAEARFRDGALGEAAVLRRRALTIAIAAYGCDSPRAARAMTALAALDIDRQLYLDAEPLLIVAARVFETARDGAALAAIDAGLARIALARGRTARAEDWARRAVAFLKRTAQADAGAPLRALAAVLTAQARYGESEQVLTEALARNRQRRGSDDPRTLSLLGNLELRRGRAERALPLLEQAAAADRQRLGAAHPFIADDFYDVGLAYEALHRDGDARRMFQAAIAVLQRGDGRDTPRGAYAEIELSRLDRRAGDNAAADAASRDARRILNRETAEEQRRERRI